MLSKNVEHFIFESRVSKLIRKQNYFIHIYCRRRKKMTELYSWHEPIYNVSKFVGDSRYEQTRAHLSYSRLCAVAFLSQRSLCSFVSTPPPVFSPSLSFKYSIYFPISVKAVLAHFRWETLRALPLCTLARCSCLCVSTQHSRNAPPTEQKQYNGSARNKT